MDLKFDSTQKFIDSTNSIFDTIMITVVTDNMIECYKNKVDYDFSDFGFDSELANLICEPHSLLPYVFLVQDCISELAHNTMIITNDAHLTRYLGPTIATFKRLKERVDFNFNTECTFKVYDTRKQNLILQNPSKTEKIFNFTQGYTLMIANLITTFENLQPAPIISKEEIDIKPSYLIEQALISKIYDFCILELLFTSDYDVSRFFECFDINKSIKVFPPFNKGKQKYFSCILLLIDDEINGLKAKECFGIKSYPTEKSRWNNDRRAMDQEEFNFKSKAQKILKVKPTYL